MTVEELVSGPIVKRPAGENLSGFRGVVVLAGDVFHADPSNPAHRGFLRGITLAAFNDGDIANVQVLGFLRNTDWAWTPGLPIYVDSAGELTQTPPAVGDLWQVAIADEPTVVYIDPQSPDDRDVRISLPFSWGDATPSTIGLVPANKLITRVELLISEEFDGTAPALRVGFTGSLDALMAANQNDPAAVATYETNPGLKFGSDKTLLLSITPGSGASAGAGLVVVTYQR